MTTAPPDIAIEELEPGTRDSLRDLILTLADSKRLLGIRYADWVLGAPELEACIAASSLAQDEWGHARILYTLLKDFGDDPNEIEHGRDAPEYRNVELLDRPFETWGEFVVANTIVDTGLTIHLEALTGSRYPTLRQRVRKQLDEERFHLGHGSAWLRRLGRSADTVRSALQQLLDTAWPAMLRWFGPDDHGAELKAAGLCSSNGSELREAFRERIAPAIEKAGFRVPEAELDFTDWDPVRRRSAGSGAGSGPDPDALARARGDRNRAFRLD